MARSGWSAAIRSSNRIYEKSPSDPRCSPRIANHLRRCSTTESRLALAVERVFQQPARPEYGVIKRRFKQTIRDLQHRYTNGSGHTRGGGLIVSDGLNGQPGGLMFR